MKTLQTIRQTIYDTIEPFTDVIDIYSHSDKIIIHTEYGDIVLDGDIFLDIQYKAFKLAQSLHFDYENGLFLFAMIHNKMVHNKSLDNVI